nr:MAG TPA: hypothetical protein [Caudoviricetes sp.]
MHNSGWQILNGLLVIPHKLKYYTLMPKRVGRFKLNRDKTTGFMP